jgi:hypothetical protein
MRQVRVTGFTNRLAIILVIFLAVGLAGGFYLALKSIAAQYSGSLLCWTVVFTPIGTAIGLVLGKIVDKSKAENTQGGIVYESQKADWDKKSPPI